ncbi:MAG: fibrobacter succinogenes major paralogous domain-containing protein [Bacteroidota bacterium]|nr:fibrobacter succinogenes major paralogous domain-containing protein [Bacteroidota bacterium]
MRLKKINLYKLAIILFTITLLSNCKKDDSTTTKETTTINQPPTAPSEPNPEGCAQNVSTNISLNWKACSDPENDIITYDIYFGETSPPPKVKSSLDNYYNPGALKINTTYFWKIIAKDNNSNSTSGPEWNFKTGSSITNGGLSPITFNTNIKYDSFIDPRDGYKYRTVKIGNRIWMAQNLNYAASGSWCYKDSAEFCNVYGRLYDWTTAMQGSGSSNDTINVIKGICPDGWHIPSDIEWNILIKVLLGDYSAGGEMKEKGTSHWNSPNKGASNISGFTALPAGFRLKSGTFFGINDAANFWSSFEYDANNAFERELGSGDTYCARSYYQKSYSLSVRCVKKTN